MSVSRRDFLALVGTSVAGAAVVGAAGRSISSSFNDKKLGDKKVSGSADSWIVESIGAVQMGAVPITLKHAVSGERLSVEACRKGFSGRQAVASSKQFDLFLVNNGQGHAQTPASHTLAVRSLAKHLDRTVKAVPTTVQTMEARLTQHSELFQQNDDPIA